MGSYYDIVIAGGGLVGLASGLKILQSAPKTRLLILEKEPGVGQHQSGHNSGVIHSGVYYKPGSAKALNCIRGYDMLLDFCKTYGIHHEVCGKVIVATNNDELPQLDKILRNGVLNGLEGLQLIGPDEIRELEPHVEGVKAIKVLQAGIVNFADVAAKYAELVVELGGEIATGHKVLEITYGKQVAVITEQATFSCGLVISCGGLYADKLAGNVSAEIDFKILPFRGEYYELKKDSEHLVNNLIYPVPDPAFPFLGVHFTRMAGGGVEAGPNAVLAYAREGYTKSQINVGELFETLGYSGFRKLAAKYWRKGLAEFRRSYSKKLFTRSLQKLIPSITMDDLVPGRAGVRAMACKPDGTMIDDFLFVESEHAIHVCNAPSPAATSSLSIGQTIAEMAIPRIKS